MAVFRVRPITVQDMPYQPLLDPSAVTSDTMICICGQCKKIQVRDTWMDLPQAVTHLRLFERPTLPGTTHGICDQCHYSLLETLAKS